MLFRSDREENLEGAIENANIARKTMKGGTEYCRVYESRMRRQREKEKEVLSQFQDNLTNGRFQVYIQPKFLLSKFELFGGEALVRLQKQDGSLEPPGVFIPILEKSGYIVELDFYMYEQILMYMHTQAGPRTLAHMEQTCNSISMCITQPREQGSH